jgi:hypothetical protein
MHLDVKYTAPEALHIFELVKGLMQKIASKMDENGNPNVLVIADNCRDTDGPISPR